MVATKIRLLDEAKPEAAEAAAIEAELAAKGLLGSNTTLADCLAATSDLDLGGKGGGDADGLEEDTLTNCANSPELERLLNSGS
jgi:hypothetical protein